MRSLPYLLIGCTVILTISIWYFLDKNVLLKHLSWETFSSALPWIGLTTGVVLTLLCTVTIRLMLLNQERQRLLQLIDNDYRNEIAERIKTEESKQKLEIALLQGQKLQAIGTLAGGIAHDFNNIIYAIKGYVEMARDDTSKETLVYKNLGKVLEATQRGQSLVARLLAFGRQNQQFEHKPVSLKLMLENVLSLLQPTIPATVQFVLNGLSDNDIILGDEIQLHQVVVNIINNAVDAMDGEGTIQIQLSHLAQDDDYLQQIPNALKNDYYKIDLTDTGQGMDQTTIKRIFEPFYTTKEVGKGTGLGLSTVHAIMNGHRGHVSVTSQLGKGTTFTLLLPNHQAKKIVNIKD